jgi:glycosyltransferase involved in cell wall biosynthesis
VNKISVLIPTYDRDEFLRQALNSLQAQTFSNWEAIVVDNGGSETTREVTEGINDQRVKYLKASCNLGECGARNLAFEHSTGDYLCYLDDDDILPRHSLESRLRFYEKHPHCGMIYGEYKKFRVDPKEGRQVTSSSNVSYLRKSYYDRLLTRMQYGQQETFYLLKFFNFVRGGTPLIKRSTFENVGLFDEQLPIYGDYEMWLRIASRYSMRFLNDEVYYYRIHDQSTQSRLSETDNRLSALRLCQKYEIRKSIQFARYHQDVARLWGATNRGTVSKSVRTSEK